MNKTAPIATFTASTTLIAAGSLIAVVSIIAGLGPVAGIGVMIIVTGIILGLLTRRQRRESGR